MTMGTGEASKRPVAVLRLCGQVSIGPSGVDAQSNARIRAGSSPDPRRKSPLEAAANLDAPRPSAPNAAVFPKRGKALKVPLMVKFLGFTPGEAIFVNVG